MSGVRDQLPSRISPLWRTTGGRPRDVEEICRRSDRQIRLKRRFVDLFEHQRLSNPLLEATFWWKRMWKIGRWIYYSSARTEASD